MNIHTFLGWLQPPRLVQLAFRLRPNSEFLIFGAQRLTRRQVWTNIRRLAAGLQALGVHPGDRVAILLPACPPAIYPIFLPALLGNINVPLNPLLREPELRHILADCEASIVITQPRLYGQDYPALLARLKPDLPALHHVIVCGATADEVDATAGHLTLDSVMAETGSLHPVPIAPTDLNLIAYTSGTSGLPKGVAHTRGRSLGLLTRAVRPELMRTPLRCLLLPFPPYHFAGTFGVVSALLAGGKVVLMDRFDPHQMLEMIQRERVTQVAAAPTMYRWMLRTSAQEDYDLSSVRRLTFSTEPCPPDLAEALYARFGCSLQNIYGTAESMIISWTGLDDPWERAATTVGKPAPGVRLRIVDDARRPLATGATGEIAVQTSQMMQGYYGDPALTAQTMDAEGWFYTGDMGYLGDDGYLRVTGRKKDMLIRGGEKIYPEEVEQTLEKHPAVRRAGVIGVTGPAGGDAVWAFVELHGGAQVTSRDMMNFARNRLAAFKVPEQVRFIERLPITVTGKVQRFRLREIAENEQADR